MHPPPTNQPSTPGAYLTVRSFFSGGCLDLCNSNLTDCSPPYMNAAQMSQVWVNPICTGSATQLWRSVPSRADNGQLTFFLVNKMQNFCLNRCFGGGCGYDNNMVGFQTCFLNNFNQVVGLSCLRSVWCVIMLCVIHVYSCYVPHVYIHSQLHTYTPPPGVLLQWQSGTVCPNRVPPCQYLSDSMLPWEQRSTVRLHRGQHDNALQHASTGMFQPRHATVVYAVRDYMGTGECMGECMVRIWLGLYEGCRDDLFSQ